MKFVNVLALLPLMTISSVVLAKDCTTEKTSVAMQECIKGEIELSEKTLNQKYDQGRKGLSKERQIKFDKANQAWAAFRKAECEFEGSYAEGGSLKPVIVGTCILRVTRNRLRLLPNILSK